MEGDHVRADAASTSDRRVGESGRRRRVVLWIAFVGALMLASAAMSMAAMRVEGFSPAWWGILTAHLAFCVTAAVAFGRYVRPRNGPRGALSRRQRWRLQWMETTGRPVDDPVVTQVALQRVEARAPGIDPSGRTVTWLNRTLTGGLSFLALLYLALFAAGAGHGPGIDALLLGGAVGMAVLALVLPAGVRRVVRRDARQIEQRIRRWRDVVR